MASLTAETFLTYIALAGPQINSGILDAVARGSIECAQILADGLLELGTVAREILSDGAAAVASLFVAGYDLTKLILKILKNDSHNQLKNKYEKFAEFIEVIKLTTNRKIDAIRVLTDEIKEQVKDILSVRREDLHAFIDSVSFRAEMIEMEIQFCKENIEFAIENIREFIDSTADANDKDLMESFTKGVACTIASVALLPFLPVAGVVAGMAALGVGSVSGYHKRKNERAKFNSDLEQEERQFELMKLNLGQYQTTLIQLKEKAERFRRNAPPPAL